MFPMAGRCTTLIKVEIFPVEITPCACQSGLDAELVLLQDDGNLMNQVHEYTLLWSSSQRLPRTDFVRTEVDGASGVL